MRKLFDRFSGMNIQVKAAMWFTVCSFLQKGIAFITVPIFTRLMSTAEYGTYTVYLSWLQILTIITSLYLYNGVYDNAMSKYADDRDRYTSSMLGLTITITGGFFAVYLLLHGVLKMVTGLSYEMMTLMFAEVLLTPAIAYWSGRKRFEYRYQAVVIVTLLRSLLNPVLGVILVRFSHGQALYRVIASVFVELLICLPLLVVQIKRGRQLFISKYWTYGLRLAIPMLPHYLSGMILSQGDRIMIDKIAGKDEVAFYGLACSIGMLVQIFVTGINSAMTPWMYARFKKREVSSMRSTLEFLFITTAIISSLLMMLAPELVMFFGPDSYRHAVYVIPPVSASVCYVFLYGVLSMPEFYFEKTQFLMVASLIAAGINIILNYIFIRLFGYIAAGYTTLACYIIYAMGHYYVGSRILHRNDLPGAMVRIQVIVTVTVLLVFFCALSSFLFPYLWLRAALLAVIAVSAFVFRNVIMHVVQTLMKKD